MLEISDGQGQILMHSIMARKLPNIFKHIKDQQLIIWHQMTHLPQEQQLTQNKQEAHTKTEGS